MKSRLSALAAIWQHSVCVETTCEKDIAPFIDCSMNHELAGNAIRRGLVAHDRTGTVSSTPSSASRASSEAVALFQPAHGDATSCGAAPYTLAPSRPASGVASGLVTASAPGAAGAAAMPTLPAASERITSKSERMGCAAAYWRQPHMAVAMPIMLQRTGKGKGKGKGKGERAGEQLS